MSSLIFSNTSLLHHPFLYGWIFYTREFIRKISASDLQSRECRSVQYFYIEKELLNAAPSLFLGKITLRTGILPILRTQRFSWYLQHLFFQKKWQF